MSIVIVAEKPSVARSIAGVVGANARGEGCLTGNGYTVTWALGHLVALSEPDEIDPAYKKWTRAALPMLPAEIPLKVLPKTRSQYAVVKKLINAKETEKIVCATDSGREGELIFRYIYEMAKCKKPVDRLWISSMTDAAIRQGMDSLKPDSEYDGLYKSAVCRSRADWLVGMNATRAYTLKHNALLSLGRVQTPTLALLVKRHLEIVNFKPDDFWTLTADFGDYQGTWFHPETNADRFLAEAEAKAAQARVKGKTGTVINVEVKQETENPPLLFDLTTLQREMNRRKGFSAQKTLDLAQSLYEKHKAITYPRTDSRYLTKDMAKILKTTLSRIPVADLAPYIRELTAREELPLSARIINDARVSDHHAIIPTTGRCNLSALTADELAVYDAVARQFVAVFLPPRITERTTVVTRVEQDHFRTKGARLVQAGFSQLFPAREETLLPALQQGDTRKVQKASVKKSATKPPQPHTEASLLSAMENAGRQIEDEELREKMKDSSLGTPATRAAIIERLIQVGYVKRKGKALTVTEKAVSLIGILPDEMTSPVTTGRWEAGLAKIARGEMDPDRFMASIARYVQFIIQSADASPRGSIPPDPYRGKKPRPASKPRAEKDAGSNTASAKKE